MNANELVQQWVEIFNRSDANALAELYADSATNHQIAEEAVHGKAAIRDMFAAQFSQARMVCLIEHIHDAGEWVILEWRDPLGLRGCGFFHVVDGKIHQQRGYWDKLTFLRQHGLPIPNA